MRCKPFGFSVNFSPRVISRTKMPWQRKTTHRSSLALLHLYNNRSISLRKNRTLPLLPVPLRAIAVEVRTWPQSAHIKIRCAGTVRRKDTSLRCAAPNSGALEKLHLHPHPLLHLQRTLKLIRSHPNRPRTPTTYKRSLSWRFAQRALVVMILLSKLSTVSIPLHSLPLSTPMTFQ